MKWFVNMKIASKLIISFLLIAVLSAGMAVFAILNLDQINRSGMQMYESMTVPIQKLAKISVAFQRERVSLRDAIMLEEPALMELALTKLEERRMEISGVVTELDSTAMSADIKSLYDRFKAANDTYDPLSKEVIRVVRSGDRATAIGMISDSSEAGIAAENVQKAINALITAKSDEALNTANANNSQAGGVMLVMVIVAGAVLVLSVGVGLVISRIVSRPVAAAAACAKAIASGDLDAPLKVRSKDETGQLAATIDGEVRQAFKDVEAARAVADKQSRYQSAEVDKLLVNLQRLARGELYCDIVVEEPDPDTAEMHALFSEIATNLGGGLNAIKGYISEISAVLGEMAKGNLGIGIESEYKGDFIELKDSINAIIDSLNAVLGEISTAADEVASGTRQVSDGSQDISQGATEQSSAIEELTATIGQIAEQTRQNAVGAGQANRLTEEAQTGAVQGNEQMKAMQQAMNEISESSRSISKIIKVIDDIAFQTNILALNAAVEAARAGVHGRGFAVVAQEVRNLAGRSASAAKETTDMIEGSIRKTVAGTKIAGETSAALNEMVEGIRKAGQLVSEIAAASGEQASAIAQVNRGIEQLSGVVQNNSATAEQAAAASEELSGQAELLKNMVGQFILKSASGNTAEKTLGLEVAKPAEVISESAETAAVVEEKPSRRAKKADKKEAAKKEEKKGSKASAKRSKKKTEAVAEAPAEKPARPSRKPRTKKAKHDAGIAEEAVLPVTEDVFGPQQDSTPVAEELSVQPPVSEETLTQPLVSEETPVPPVTEEASIQFPVAEEAPEQPSVSEAETSVQPTEKEAERVQTTEPTE